LEAKNAVENWARENPDSIEARLNAERTFMSEKYALTVLCGSLLQVATMAIRLHSRNRQIPDHLNEIASSHASFCIGRVIRKVPIGLVVLAARNQYSHIEDAKPHKLSSGIFELLATEHGHDPQLRDPCLDLEKKLKWNYASNVIGLLGWRECTHYEQDMRSMLGI